MTTDDEVAAGHPPIARAAAPDQAAGSRRAWTWALLGAAAAALMAPRLASPQFGLLDDGLVPHAAASSLADAIFQFDRESGRFRPLYWLWLIAQYRLWGPSPLAFYAALCAALAITAGLIAETVRLAAKDVRAGLLAGLAFLLAPPVVENYYTLAKAEPWLCLWLAMSSYWLATALDAADEDAAKSWRRLAGAAACLLPAYFWKETAHAMLIVSLAWLAGGWLAAWRSPRCRLLLGYAVANAGCAALYAVAHALSGTAAIGAGTYSTHYNLELDPMGQGALRHLAFMVRDFPMLLIAAAVWGALRPGAAVPLPGRVRALVFAGAAWIAGWTAVMLPWRATFEYYLLPLSMGAAALTGVVLADIAGDARRLGWISRAALGVAACLAAVVAVNSATNGRVQLTVDAANAELVEFVAARAPRGGSVLVNLPEDSEYLVELREHLARLHGRPDVAVGALGRAERASGALVANPIMRHQPFPTVRLGFSEAGSGARANDLKRYRLDGGGPAYRRVHAVPLAYVALEAPVCPLLIWTGALGGVSCGIERPLVDRRRFEYGWEVYAVDVGDPPRQPLNN